MSKRIAFRAGVGNQTPDSDTLILASSDVDSAEFPQTGSGITCGFLENNAGSTIGVGLAGITAYSDQLVVNSGGTSRLLRVNVAGPVTVKLHCAMPVGQYRSGRWRILDSDAVTELYPGGASGNIITDGDPDPALVVTNNTKVSLTGPGTVADKLATAAAADPGVAITPSGGSFVVELTNASGPFALRMSTVVVIPSAPAGARAAALYYSLV